MAALRYPDHETQQLVERATERLKDKACDLIHGMQKRVDKKMQLLSSGFMSASDFHQFLEKEYHRIQIEKQQAIIRFEQETEKLHDFLNSHNRESRRINAALAAFSVYFDNDLIGEMTFATKQWWMYMQGEFRYPELYVYLEEAFLPIKQRCEDWIFDRS